MGENAQPRNERTDGNGVRRDRVEGGGERRESERGHERNDYGDVEPHTNAPDPLGRNLFQHQVASQIQKVPMT